jgi:hypothetical protein
MTAIADKEDQMERRGRNSVRNLIVLFFVAISLLVAGPVTAGKKNVVVIDQQQPLDVGWYAGLDSENETAQTFTVGIKGYLQKVSLQIRKEVGMDYSVSPPAPLPPGDLIVEIRSAVMGTAAVDGGNSGYTTTLIPSDQVLSTATLPESAIAENLWQWYEVAFPVPCFLYDGQTYVIVLRSNGLPPTDPMRIPGAYSWLMYGSDTVDAYAGGENMGRGPGTGYYWSVSRYWLEDVTFRTYMQPARKP